MMSGRLMEVSIAGRGSCSCEALVGSQDCSDYHIFMHITHRFSGMPQVVCFSSHKGYRPA